MTRSLIGFATSLAFLVGLGFAAAQAPPIGRTPPQTMGTNQTRPRNPSGPRLTIPKNSRAVTATGCLKLEREVAARPDVTRGGGGTGDGYVLIGTKLKGSGVATGGQEATAETYRVAGLSDGKLREHLNEQVEVKGRLNLGLISSPDDDTKSGKDGDNATSTDNGKTDGKSNGQTSTGTASASDQKDQQKGLPMITASSIKTLAESCEAGSN